MPEQAFSSYARTWKGWLIDGPVGEGDALWLSPQPDRRAHSYEMVREIVGDEPLAWQIKEAMEDHGEFLSVRYYVAPEEFTPEAMTEAVALLMVGEGYANVGHRYSEITGYLWTDEEINVGNHDLIAELYSHAGKFLHLEIEFSKEGVHV